MVAARSQLGTNFLRSWPRAAACCRGGVGRAGRGVGVVGIVIFFGDFGSRQRVVAGRVVDGDDVRGQRIRELAQRGGRAGRRGVAPGLGHRDRVRGGACGHRAARCGDGQPRLGVGVGSKQSPGQNAPAIADIEAAYEQMWALDVAAMFGYHADASAAVAKLPPWNQVLQNLGFSNAGAAVTRARRRRIPRLSWKVMRTKKKVDLQALADALADYPYAYLITVDDEYRAHTVTVEPQLREATLDIGLIGGRTRNNLAKRADVTLLWPPPNPAATR